MVASGGVGRDSAVMVEVVGAEVVTVDEAAMVEVVNVMVAGVVTVDEAAMVVVVDVVNDEREVVKPGAGPSDRLDGRYLSSARGGWGFSLGAFLLGRVAERSLLPSLPRCSIEGDLSLLLSRLSLEGEPLRRPGVGVGR